MMAQSVGISGLQRLTFLCFCLFFIFCKKIKIPKSMKFRDFWRQRWESARCYATLMSSGASHTCECFIDNACLFKRSDSALDRRCPPDIYALAASIPTPKGSKQIGRCLMASPYLLEPTVGIEPTTCSLRIPKVSSHLVSYISSGIMQSWSFNTAVSSNLIWYHLISSILMK